MADTADTKPTPVEDTKKEESSSATGAAATVSDAKSTIVDAASTAASTATTAAVTAKDNVFSMFGGGPKKEKKVEEDVDEPSGSSKAQKKDDVRILSVMIFPHVLLKSLSPQAC
jgi:Ran-binding protein 1